MNTTAAKSKSLIKFIERLARRHRGKILRIYLDNPPVHRSKVLKKWLVGHSRVVLKPLLRYSPDINPQEQWWNYERAKLLNNTYFNINQTTRRCSPAFRQEYTARNGEECLQSIRHVRISQAAALLLRNAIMLPMIKSIESARAMTS